MNRNRSRRSGQSAALDAVLTFIRFHQDEQGYPPTIREIMVGCRLSTTSLVNHYLNKLAAQGLIERVDGTARGIRLVPQDDAPTALTTLYDNLLRQKRALEQSVAQLTADLHAARQRIVALVADNADLRRQVRALEAQLTQANAKARRAGINGTTDKL